MRHVKVRIIIREFIINFTSLSIENGVPLIQWRRIFNAIASINTKQDLPDVSPSGNKTADKSRVSFWLSSTIINHRYFNEWKKISLLLVTNSGKRKEKYEWLLVKVPISTLNDNVFRCMAKKNVRNSLHNMKKYLCYLHYLHSDYWTQIWGW